MFLRVPCVRCPSSYEVHSFRFVKFSREGRDMVEFTLEDLQLQIFIHSWLGCFSNAATLPEFGGHDLSGGAGVIPTPLTWVCHCWSVHADNCRIVVLAQRLTHSVTYWPWHLFQLCDDILFESKAHSGLPSFSFGFATPEERVFQVIETTRL